MRMQSEESSPATPVFFLLFISCKELAKRALKPSPPTQLLLLNPQFGGTPGPQVSLHLSSQEEQTLWMGPRDGSKRGGAQAPSTRQLRGIRNGPGRNSQTHWGHVGMWAQSYQENQSTRFLWEFSQLQMLAIQSDLKNHCEGQISRSRGCIQHFERNINSSKPEVYDLEQRGSNSPRGVLQDQRGLMDQKRDGNKNHVRSHHPLLTCCSIHVQACEKYICGYRRSAWFLYLIGLSPDVHSNA